MVRRRPTPRHETTRARSPRHTDVPRRRRWRASGAKTLWFLHEARWAGHDARIQRFILDAALETSDSRSAGAECRFQCGERFGRAAGSSAHENIDGGVLALGPGVNGDVGFGKEGNARDAFSGAEVMQLQLQECNPRNRDSL